MTAFGFTLGYSWTHISRPAGGPTAFSVLGSDGTVYAPSLTILDSAGASYTVTNTVLDSAGASHTTV